MATIISKAGSRCTAKGELLNSLVNAGWKEETPTQAETVAESGSNK